MAGHSNKNLDYLVLNIKELMKDDDDDDEGLQHTDVCVHRVPKSLSSANPEAFTPQFVGLGPYHHRRPEVITEQRLKATAVKRVLNHRTHHLIELVTKLRDSNLAAQIRNCYDTSLLEFQDDDDTLLYLMAVDTLFLLDLLRSFQINKEEEGTNGVVTKFDLQVGKQLGLPLVNSVGIEFTKDAIIRDVFMLENQIPIHILHQIITVIDGMETTDEPCVDQYNVLPKMLYFCRAFCPLVNIDQQQQLSNQSQQVIDHHHLLDLMYHLMVPPELKPKPDDDSQQHLHEPTKPNETDSQHDGPNLNEPKPNETKPNETDSQPKPEEPKPDEARTTCCFRCCYILLFLFVSGSVILYLVMVFLGAILDLILWVLHKLLDGLASLTDNCYPYVKDLNDYLRNSNIPFMNSITLLLGQVERVCQLCMPEQESANTTHQDVTIPSVMQLSHAGICFQPADAAAGTSFSSSICYDEKKCIFYLPKIRVDVNSEVIIRNLVAYESLTESDSLIFTRYVELMRAIIDTAGDVKLLVDQNIIQTQLSHEQVAQLFNRMSKSIRPTHTPELDKDIHKVNKKFKDKGKLHRFITKYVSPSGRFLAVVAGLALLVLTAMQSYCSLYGCSATSNSDNLPKDGYNNYYSLISSM